MQGSLHQKMKQQKLKKNDIKTTIDFDNKVNTAVRRTNHIHMTVQVTHQSCQPRCLRILPGSQKHLLKKKICAQFDISAAKEKEDEHYNELRMVYGLPAKRAIFFFLFLFFK